MTQLNASDEYLCGVEEAFVVGSYLGENQRLGDLDISSRLDRKETDGDRFSAAALRSANASGRNFANFIDKLYWPETQVMLFLKQRSRVFSLHREEPLLAQDPSIPRRPIFRERRPVSWTAETPDPSPRSPRRRASASALADRS